MAIGVVVLWLWTKTKVTRENAARLRPGMSLAEVEAILGSPGDYASGQTAPDRDDNAWKRNVCFGQAEDLSRNWKEWNSDVVWIKVKFGPEGTVVGATVTPVNRLDRGPVAYMRQEFQRRWQSWFPGQTAVPPTRLKPRPPQPQDSPGPD